MDDQPDSQEKPGRNKMITSGCQVKKKGGGKK